MGTARGQCEHGDAMGDVREWGVVGWVAGCGAAAWGYGGHGGCGWAVGHRWGRPAAGGTAGLWEWCLPCIARHMGTSWVGDTLQGAAWTWGGSWQ